MSEPQTEDLTAEEVEALSEIAERDGALERDSGMVHIREDVN